MLFIPNLLTSLLALSIASVYSAPATLDIGTIQDAIAKMEASYPNRKLTFHNTQLMTKNLSITASPVMTVLKEQPETF
ncbi:hypothetical protein QBC36DRAFT_291815 [Triangularia setosa]|uniref:Uncharacterized protein n=1 Tax=Triangularia setosa TaxID=2587417 RepID=A0AAN6W4N3_9PEZI|nr:hypothetical protein QBC36DRAFT_291815 [Podospora setosa]